MIVLDTNVVLHLIAGRVSDRFPLETIVVSTITEIELLSYPAISDLESAVLEDFLASVYVAELDSAIKRVAIKVRKAHRLRLPDAIIAATALHIEIPLATFDQHFNRVTGLNLQQPTWAAPDTPQNQNT